jgi:hypothetical protein
MVRKGFARLFYQDHLRASLRRKQVRGALLPQSILLFCPLAHAQLTPWDLNGLTARFMAGPACCRPAMYFFVLCRSLSLLGAGLET